MFSTKFEDCQVRERNGVAHVQINRGNGSYDKFDVELTPALKNYLNEQIEEGNTKSSLAGTSTQYVPMVVRTGQKEVKKVVTSVETVRELMASIA